MEVTLMHIILSFIMIESVKFVMNLVKINLHIFKLNSFSMFLCLQVLLNASIVFGGQCIQYIKKHKYFLIF